MPKRKEGPTKSKQTGFYYFDQWIGFPPDKFRIRYSLRTKDPAKAEWLWEREYKRQWSKYYGVELPGKPKDIRFSELAEEYIEYERDIKKVKEWRTIRDRLRIVSEIWKNPLLSETDKTYFVQLDQALKNKSRSKSTINHYFSLLKAVFSFAAEKGILKGANPVKEITPYIINEKRREYSLDEIGRILEAAEKIEKQSRKNTALHKYAKRIVLLLFYTGMRLNEVLNLRWDNIKDNMIILKRTETKQKREKVIPLTEGIQKVLDSLKDNRYKNGYVIPLRRQAGKMRTSWADTLIKKIREYSGVKDFIFHNIRHTASTLMISEAIGKGVGLADVMKVLGHSEIKTTLKYLHSDFDRMRKAVEILEKKVDQK